jgi:REP element-mobilizing transposase RayT
MALPVILAKPVNCFVQNVPDLLPEAGAVFLTWRLQGSLPNGFAGCLPLRTNLLANEEFRWLDRMLDRATCGPVWLQDPRIAGCVVGRLARGQSDFRQYDLHAFVVMANHLHMLLTPRVPMRTLTDGLKGVIARMANRMLGRRGERFWDDESFGHWARDGAQFTRIKNYIERNPVRAGLVSKPEDWPWSSAYRTS